MKIKTLDELEEDQIRKVLNETHWNMQKTARLLQITLSQLKRKIQKYEIESNKINHNLDNFNQDTDIN